MNIGFCERIEWVFNYFRSDVEDGLERELRVKEFIFILCLVCVKSFCIYILLFIIRSDECDVYFYWRWNSWEKVELGFIYRCFWYIGVFGLLYLSVWVWGLGVFFLVFSRIFVVLRIWWSWIWVRINCSNCRSISVVWLIFSIWIFLIIGWLFCLLVLFSLR